MKRVVKNKLSAGEENWKLVPTEETAREKAKKWECRRNTCEMLNESFGWTVGNEKRSFGNVTTVEKPGS